MTQIEINFSTYMPSGATFYTYFSILQSLDKPSEAGLETGFEKPSEPGLLKSEHYI